MSDLNIQTADEWYNLGHLLLTDAIKNTPKKNNLDSDEDFYVEPPLIVKEYYQKALDAFEKCLELNPKDVEALKEKSSCLIFQERYKEALLSIDKAIELKADDFFAWNTKWICLFKLDRLEEAEIVWAVMNKLKKGGKDTDNQIPPQSTGNSTGNVMNGGYAAISGKWIFYINANDGNKIYRIPINCTKGEMICEDYARCLNIVDDWIYYFKYKRNKDEILEYSINKMRLDGSDCQKACTAGSDSYFLDDGWIYYTDYFDEQKMYRVKIDGSMSERIVSDNIGTLFCVVWNKIYYRTNAEFCQMKFDGTERVVLDWIETWNFVVVEDWIYYKNRKDYSSLYKIKTDGTMKQKLNDHDSENMNVSGDWIYYNRIDEDNHLYRIRLDGTQNERLNEDDTFGHCIAGDWIYYLIKTEDYSMYRIHVDGTNREKV